MFRKITSVQELNSLHNSVMNGELVISRDALLDMSNCACRLMNDTNDENEISVLHAIRFNCNQAIENQFQL